jgi:hypothetical protein
MKGLRKKALNPLLPFPFPREEFTALALAGRARRRFQPAEVRLPKVSAPRSA